MNTCPVCVKTTPSSLIPVKGTSSSTNVSFAVLVSGKFFPYVQAAATPAPVRVKSVYAKEDQLWVKFERLDGKDDFNTRIDNAYQQFRNTKEMTQEEIDKAEWMKARNKLDSPAFVQKMIQEGKDINALMNVAGYTRERFEKIVEKSQGKSLEVPSKEELPSLSRADVPKPTRSKSKGQEKMQEKTGESVM